MPPHQLSRTRERYAQTTARGRCFLAGSVCWALFVLVAVLVDTGAAQELDRAGLLYWRTTELGPRGPGWLLEAVRDFTSLGGVLLRHLIVLGAAASLLFLRHKRESLLLIATVLSGWWVNTGLKLLVARPRPEIVPHLAEAGGMSFPSGHSFNAAVAYTAIALTFGALTPRRSVRVAIMTCALVMTLLIAMSRVWLGVHYPTDCAAGWLGGTGWALLSATLFAPPDGEPVSLPPQPAKGSSGP